MLQQLLYQIWIRGKTLHQCELHQQIPMSLRISLAHHSQKQVITFRAPTLRGNEKRYAENNEKKR
jgi:hypothetical protein